ncbi:hypothetical protein LOD99_8485 [Oopsacas minuta]|uniref:ATP-dependent DNA helicase n=1 Tax=Oopsacas minuta TaxID=111878 RepID=A0AAV7JG80_9METZ|nr:hypothetical protein LOD99_8485 [Oopsacas minuta]
MLLHHVHGPTTFDDLRTVDGHICQTYREACNKRGLLENDSHWNDTLTEASTTDSPTKLRYLFTIMLINILSEDVLCQFHQDNSTIESINTEAIYNIALQKLEELVLSLSDKILRDFGIPSPDYSTNTTTNRELLRATSYCIEDLESFTVDNEPLLTPDQAAAYHTVINKVLAKSGGIIFLDAPGGTGKTFLINLILAKFRSQNKIALAVASSGIAATLLEGGRTAHSTFKLPLNLTHEDTPICNIKKGSGIATVLEWCHLIVWDECTMSHKKAFEALDRTLRDIRDNNIIFGGIP